MPQGYPTTHVLLVSDSTGETGSGVVSAAASQFSQAQIKLDVWPFLRRPADIDALDPQLFEKADLVVYTIVRAETRTALERRCRRADVRAIPLLDPLLTVLAEVLGTAPISRPGLQHALGPAYHERISAMEFARLQDDGHAPDRLLEADVVLTGVSRTSKTPTCFYLAQHGVRAANVPFVAGTMPVGLIEALEAGVPVLALTADARRLAEIRSVRSERLGAGISYADPRTIEDELTDALLFFERHAIPVIDVTRRSIEETAAEVRTRLKAESGV
ncbi:MAG: pyruvate, water dikinase regulatory protein [Pseudomonadota bacterium]